MNESRRATTADYIALQGGEPSVEPNNRKLCYVVYAFGEFSNEPRYVTTRLPLESMGTVTYDVGGVLVDFLVAKVWSLHGEPCERASSRIGDRKGYRR